MAKEYPITDKSKLRMMAAILLKQSYRNYLLFAMGCNLGLRISDYINMSVKDCSELCRTKKVDLQQVKTKKPIYFEVPDEVHEIMSDYISGKEPGEWLFPSRKGSEPITEHQAWNIVWQAANEADITQNIGCHSLRKTFGYFHYKKNNNIRILMEIFQHVSEAITLRYIGVIQDEMDDSMRGISIGGIKPEIIQKAKIAEELSRRTRAEKLRILSEKTNQNEGLAE